MLQYESQLGFYVDQLFEFGQTDFGTSWLYSSLGEKSFSMEPEYMPRWWVGSPYMDANPDFEATYLEWEKGKSISDIELPIMPQNPEKIQGLAMARRRGLGALQIHREVVLLWS